MTLPDPRRAPARTDLPWLRHRPLRRVPASPAPRVNLQHPGRPPLGTGRVTPAAPSAGASSLDLTRPSAPVPAPAPDAAEASVAVSSSLDLSSPGLTSSSLDLSSAASSSLDLSTQAPAPASSSLDLSTPAPAESSSDLSTPPAASSLDLGPSTGAAATPSARALVPVRRQPSAAQGDPVLGYEPERVVVGRPTLLNRDRPTVALTRVQSGVGVLRLTMAVGSGVGDLRPAAFCHLSTGETVLLDHNRGMTTAPAGSRRPVVQAVDRGFLVDLRQVSRLQRLVIAGFSPTSSSLAWGGALRVETIGGARVDVPLEREPGAGSLVALSILNVGGQLVLRAERQLVPGALREAALAFGFDGLTWVDAWTPLG
ncbi:hypothetical protein [Cellulomonas edaphi]|uniref:Uncharacterized protein n=1 Tax=Cellulomonas edaphi TaxID=3053468 RepID=A0ABT7S536_9CELL|nr:hypothetical protein [Cellulomons edaphi]MDM7830733.1 hypothetical protein [Cellulomons edaphi]